MEQIVVEPTRICQYTKSTRKPLFVHLLFIKARAIIQVSKRGTSFVIYPTPTREVVTTLTQLP